MRRQRDNAGCYLHPISMRPRGPIVLGRDVCSSCWTLLTAENVAPGQMRLNRRACRKCRVKEVTRARNKKRAKALKEYGGKCACCGEWRKEFLTFDHVNGDGAEHRRQLGNSSSHRILNWIRDNHYPKSIRILCFNCNFSLGCRGYCPHRKHIPLRFDGADVITQGQGGVVPSDLIESANSA